MRIDHLNDLIEIDRCRSISGAAQKLYLGQTTLSSILKNVESEVGFKIFERTTGGVTATPDGETVLGLAKEICSKFERIRQLDRPDSRLRQSITLLAAPSISCGLALPLNAALQKEEPCITLNLEETTGEKIGSAIIQNAANIGITYYSPQAREEYGPVAKKYDVQIQTLYHDRLYALLPRDHPLSARVCLAPQDFRGESLVLLSHFLTDSDTTLLKNNRFVYQKHVGQIKQAVAQQNMVSILCGFPIFYDQTTDGEGLSVVPMDGFNSENAFTLCLLHRARQNLCRSEQKLLDSILRYFEELPLPALQRRTEAGL